MYIGMTYSPWKSLKPWRHNVKRTFGTLEQPGRHADAKTVSWSPSVDVKDEGDAYVLFADLPGVDPKEIDVQMEKGILTIKGKRTPETREREDSYSHIERVTGTFLRRFSVPDTADAERVTARSVNGVLEVRLPKHQPKQRRRISVEAEA